MKQSLIPKDLVESKIFYIRGEKVMIDRDLAILYGVPTKRLNEQTKRNKERFPEDFMFQLNIVEYNELVANCDRFKIPNINKKNILRSQIATSSWGGQRYLPFAFTEQGVAMLSSVLRSSKAIQINIAIMRVFVKIKEFSLSYKFLEEKIFDLERKYKGHDGKINEFFKTLNYLIRLDKENGRKKTEIGFKVK
jgi:hypothetical protein